MHNFGKNYTLLMLQIKALAYFRNGPINQLLFWANRMGHDVLRQEMGHSQIMELAKWNYLYLNMPHAVNM
jgi:hypothetical protein